MPSGGLLTFIARRLAICMALLVFVSFLVFSMLYIAPGNVVDILLGSTNVERTPELVQSMRKQYHLDEPFLTQYWLWAKDAAQLDFGNSAQTQAPVIESIKARLPTSLFLGVYAFVLTMVWGVGLGIVAALRRGSVLDRAVVGGTIVGMSAPAFVTGVLLLYVLAIEVPLFPVFGAGSGFFDELWHLTLPALSLAVVSSAFVLKHTRAAMLGVLDQDYVVFARARGLSPRRTLFAYELRNALIPIVTISTLIFAGLITGAVFVESIFSVPGIGELLVSSTGTKDQTMLQAIALLIAVVTILANLLSDLLYIAVDPRVRLGRRSA